MFLLILRALIRLALLGLLAYLVYRLLRSLFHAVRQPDESGHGAHHRAGEEMVLDPECGTHIPLSDALSAQVAGAKRYFCSRECREAYLRKHN